MLIAMKATIDIPDDLYRKLSARSAEQGRPVDAVAVDLLRRGLDEEPDISADPGVRARLDAVERMVRLAHEFAQHAPPGPTATEILEADRNRLESH
jgi:hypothetical protein